uniref:DDE Tnp4 domain-containing protein n=1 Tax=Chenopodium quinoa TaxID=63459 RepID=A0A803MUY1_CHEQI
MGFGFLVVLGRFQGARRTVVGELGKRGGGAGGDRWGKWEREEERGRGGASLAGGGRGQASPTGGGKASRLGVSHRQWCWWLAMARMPLRKQKKIATTEPVTENCQDDRWKWFKNCLGALDGTHINVRVGDKDKVRFRNRKGEISTNVLGNYYFCDAGYMNCEGFLTPFRGQRYHLSVWKNGSQPLCAEEYFNMKHSQARNVIERCFGLLKMRWGILRNTTWYRRKVVCRIILGCALVHNFIRTYMNVDPMEHLIENYMQEDAGESIEVMETSTAWNSFRHDLATEMYASWLQSRAD